MRYVAPKTIVSATQQCSVRQNRRNAVAHRLSPRAAGKPRFRELVMTFEHPTKTAIKLLSDNRQERRRSNIHTTLAVEHTTHQNTPRTKAQREKRKKAINEKQKNENKADNAAYAKQPHCEEGDEKYRAKRKRRGASRPSTQSAH